MSVAGMLFSSRARLVASLWTRPCSKCLQFDKRSWEPSHLATVVFKKKTISRRHRVLHTGLAQLSATRYESRNGEMHTSLLVKRP